MPTLTPAAGVRLPHSVMKSSVWLHHSNATPSVKTTSRPALPSMAAASITRARIRTFITLQRSTVVLIDYLHRHCEVFWSILESCMLMGWFPISSCWVVCQHLAWLSILLPGFRVIRLRSSLSMRMPWHQSMTSAFVDFSYHYWLQSQTILQFPKLYSAYQYFHATLCGPCGTHLSFWSQLSLI